MAPLFKTVQLTEMLWNVLDVFYISVRLAVIRLDGLFEQEEIYQG